MKNNLVCYCMKPTGEQETVKIGIRWWNEKKALKIVTDYLLAHEDISSITAKYVWGIPFFHRKFGIICFGKALYVNREGCTF